ncbi:MAG: FHA domain-containing protein [bacterium]
MAHEEAMRLIVLRGLEGRREYVLKGDSLVVGRPSAGAAPDIAIDAPDILERHAELRREGATFRLAPMPGARVVVNRRDFPGGLLNDGDQVAFGGALFQFWAGGLKGEAPRPYAAPGASHQAPSPSSAPPMQPPHASPSARGRFGVFAIVIVVVAAAIALAARQLAQRPLP